VKVLERKKEKQEKSDGFDDKGSRKKRCCPMLRRQSQKRTTSPKAAEERGSLTKKKETFANGMVIFQDFLPRAKGGKQVLRGLQGGTEIIDADESEQRGWEKEHPTFAGQGREATHQTKKGGSVIRESALP